MNWWNLHLGVLASPQVLKKNKNKNKKPLIPIPEEPKKCHNISQPLSSPPAYSERKPVKRPFHSPSLPQTACSVCNPFNFRAKLNRSSVISIIDWRKHQGVTQKFLQTETSMRKLDMKAFPYLCPRKTGETCLVPSSREIEDPSCLCCGLSSWLSGQESASQCRRFGFDP